ncbi:hypothetical protein HPC49_08905 [Pyxidicoccus fallax]|uniref:Uncharacterized protein n=1 Tax=Pyxidicoccus fallax TaxID=394095 RepID=A0A848LGF8_9BACT|nr:hypothetical protein [Pyxidicoccus fallax]NMO16583.1 hypothetical protein [Pyxidicoccus fallax]NPC78364.1 hypothetical protein [Pyxidicoccus fallax]
MEQGREVAPLRAAHLVGSIPAAETAEAMRLALELLGKRLRFLPDGEAGTRRNWIAHIIDSFRKHPDLELRRNGDWSSYKEVPSFGVRRGHRLTEASLDLGYVAAYAESYEVFRRLRAQAGMPDLRFQAGLPGDLDLALFTLGPVGALRWGAAFRGALLRELRQLHALGGADIVFQLEAPVELVTVSKAPGLLQSPLASYFASRLAGFAREAPEGARFGVHLCLGDLNHASLGRLGDARPIAELVNALTRAWPGNRPLEYVHVPFAAGESTAPTDARFYAPLARVVLPERTRFVAGLVHERWTEAETRPVLQHVERALGRRVDVAAACGLGRRSRDEAVQVMRTTLALCGD